MIRAVLEVELETAKDYDRLTDIISEGILVNVIDWEVISLEGMDE